MQLCIFLNAELDGDLHALLRVQRSLAGLKKMMVSLLLLSLTSRILMFPSFSRKTWRQSNSVMPVA